MKKQYNYSLTDINTWEVFAGLTILHEGQIKTVCRNNIKRGFLGITLFGDSYCSGLKPVKLVTFKLNQKG